MRTQPIHEEDWDYLIILDACRFDYFERLYSDYLDGELEKVRSRASSTQPWLWKTFPDEYEYSYLSTNPFVNEDGYALDYFSSRHKDWSAVGHFTEIIDLWKTAWDEEKDTVLPEKVAEATIEYKEKKPLIVHFVQPHVPYLTYDGRMEEFQSKKNIEGNRDKSLMWEVSASAFHLFPYEWRNRFKKAIGIKGKNNLEKIADEEGDESLRKYYEENLESALKVVKSLREEQEGKMIVTADHGEMLGEKEEYGHEVSSDEPLLREVPWLEVEDTV